MEKTGRTNYRLGVLNVSIGSFPNGILGRIQMMDKLKELGVRSVLGTHEDMLAFRYQVLCLCDSFEDHNYEVGSRIPEYELNVAGRLVEDQWVFDDFRIEPGSI